MPLKTNVTFHALPFVEPIAHGRLCAGTNSVASSQASATTTYTAPAAASFSARLPIGPGKPSSTSSARPGSATNDSRIFTSKATPSTAAPASSQRIRPVSQARTKNTSASTISTIITPSIVSLREVITSTGSSASAAAAASPAVVLHMRFTARNSSGTAAMPANASGSFSVVAENPNSFTLATCSHRSTGGLSIDTLPPGSNAPKKKLCHEMPMLRTAAS